MITYCGYIRIHWVLRLRGTWGQNSALGYKVWPCWRPWMLWVSFGWLVLLLWHGKPGQYLWRSVTRECFNDGRAQNVQLLFTPHCWKGGSKWLNVLFKKAHIADRCDQIWCPLLAWPLLGQPDVDQILQWWYCLFLRWHTTSRCLVYVMNWDSPWLRSMM